MFVFVCLCVFVFFVCLFFCPRFLAGNLDNKKFATRCSVGFFGSCFLISLTLVSVRRPRSFSCGGQRRGRRGPSLWR